MKLAEYKAMQERCSNCSYCKWIPFDKVSNKRFAEACPSVGYYNFNTYSARGRFQLGLALVNGEQEIDEEIKRIADSCLSCGACDVSCKICRYNLEPLEHNIAMKAEAVRAVGMLKGQQEAMASLAAEGTMFPGRRKEERTEWLEGVRVKKVLEEKCEVLFFPGCNYSYNRNLQPTAREILELLIESGADIGVLGEADSCCAGRAWQQGLEEDFGRQAEANVGLIRRSGVKTIVTPCADCMHALKRLYGPYGLKVEVLHVVEYLERLVKEGKLHFSREVNMTVTYHDPCHLGRQGEAYVPWEGKEKKILNQVHTWEPRRPRYNGAYGIYDAPRNLLKAIPGIKLREMTRIREYSWCCGAGGGCGKNDPELSKWTAGERMTEAMSTGAEAIVTACPWCVGNLSRAVGEDGSIPVFDILVLVLKAR